MPPLQVKDCPAELYERLRACAKGENRSISQQTLTIIQQYLDERDARGSGADVPGWMGEQNAAAPRRRSYYVEDRSVDYSARHREVVKRIKELPPIPVTDTCPPTAEIIAQIREEEAM